MKYISPFTLFDVTPENINTVSIQRAKKRLLAEFELARTTTIKIKGKEFDKNTLLTFSDELISPERLEIHSKIYNYKSLFNFFEKSNPDFFEEPFHPELLGENALSEIAICFPDHYSETFANAYESLDPLVMRKMRVDHPLIDSKTREKTNKLLAEKLTKQQNDVNTIIKQAQQRNWTFGTITTNILMQLFVLYRIPPSYKRLIQFYLQPKLAECIELLPNILAASKYILTENIAMLIRFAPDQLFETNRISLAKIYLNLVAYISTKDSLNALINKPENSEEVKTVPIPLARTTGFIMLMPLWIFLITRTIYYYFYYDRIQMLQPNFIFYNILGAIIGAVGIILALTFTLYNVQLNKWKWFFGLLIGNIFILPIFWRKFLFRKDDYKCNLLFVVTLLLPIETVLLTLTKILS